MNWLVLDKVYDNNNLEIVGKESEMSLSKFLLAHFYFDK